MWMLVSLDDIARPNASLVKFSRSHHYRALDLLESAPRSLALPARATPPPCQTRGPKEQKKVANNRSQRKKRKKGIHPHSEAQENRKEVSRLRADRKNACYLMEDEKTGLEEDSHHHLIARFALSDVHPAARWPAAVKHLRRVTLGTQSEQDWLKEHGEPRGEGARRLDHEPARTPLAPKAGAMECDPTYSEYMGEIGWRLKNAVFIPSETIAVWKQMLNSTMLLIGTLCSITASWVWDDMRKSRGLMGVAFFMVLMAPFAASMIPAQYFYDWRSFDRIGAR